MTLPLASILLGVTVVALIVALALVRARERRAAALGAAERRLRLELEQKSLDLAKTTEDVKAGQMRLVQAEKVALLSGLVTGITHELNNPLAVISGFAELLLARPTDAESRESLEAIHSEAKRCSRIVQNLLSFSRQQRTTKAAVDLNEIVDHVLELLRYKLTLDEVALDVKLDRHAPTVLGDISQLQQLALHLVMNAHRAGLETPAGTPRKISIETRGEGHDLVFAVADTGKPIAEADAPRIFDPFFFAGGHGREGGLGLSVCFGIATEHGGTIALENAPPWSSRFVVRLPAARATGGDSRRLAPAPAKPAERQFGVLVADDEEQILKLLTQILTREGYRCGTARDGVDALTQLRSGEYDIAIIDVVMPRLSGIEVYRRLATETPGLAERVIFTTGDAGGSDTQAFLQEVPNRRLKKPFEIDEVKRAVADATTRA